MSAAARGALVREKKENSRCARSCCPLDHALALVLLGLLLVVMMKMSSDDVRGRLAPL